MRQTVMIYNKWLTHSADSLEDNSPNLLEGTFIQDTTQILFSYIFFFPLLIHSVLWLNHLTFLLLLLFHSFGFSNSTELNGRSPDTWLLLGKWQFDSWEVWWAHFGIRRILNLRHLKRIWPSHLVYVFLWRLSSSPTPHPTQCYYLLIGGTLYWQPLVCSN